MKDIEMVYGKCHMHEMGCPLLGQPLQVGCQLIIACCAKFVVFLSLSLSLSDSLSLSL